MLFLSEKALTRRKANATIRLIGRGECNYSEQFYEILQHYFLVFAYRIAEFAL